MLGHSTTQWDIVLHNTTPYTRWCLTACSRWFSIRCVEVSRTCNAALPYLTPSPEVLRMNLFNKWMLHPGITKHNTEVISAYETNTWTIDTRTTWHRDYHLMMRLKPRLTICAILCVTGDADVIEFAITKSTQGNYTVKNATICACNLVHRGMHHLAMHVLDVVRSAVSHNLFMDMFRDVMVFVGSDHADEYYDKYCPISSIAHRGVRAYTDTYRYLLCGGNPSTITWKMVGGVTAHHVYTAACSNNLEYTCALYFDGVNLLPDIWRPYCKRIISEEIFRFVCERESINGLITSYINDTPDDCFAVALGYVTDTDVLIANMRVHKYIDAIIRRHKQLGKPMQTMYQKIAIRSAIDTNTQVAPTLDIILQLLTDEQACADVYYDGLEYAAKSRQPLTVINKLVTALTDALANTLA